MKRIRFLLPFLLLVTGCLGGLDELTDVIEACGLSFGDVQQQNDISDDCREAIESLLPDAQNNFSGRLVVLGTDLNETNQRLLYVHGIDASGTPLTAEQLQEASVTVIDGTTETVLPAGAFAIEALEGLTTDLASISVVTDYSGSMTDQDLDTAAEIHTDLFNILPPIYEAEVILFSETVFQKLEFSEDSAEILAAVARDDSFERSSTALYDGMGTALAHLVTRDRPIRFLITATDGLENASTTYTKAQLIETIDSNRIFVLMLGSLFSDVDEMEELAGENGIYFYAPSYDALKEAVTSYIESLGEAVQIAIDTAYQGADAARVTVGDLSTTVTFE